jgi:hypothetical protein
MKLMVTVNINDGHGWGRDRTLTIAGPDREKVAEEFIRVHFPWMVHKVLVDAPEVEDTNEGDEEART